MSHVTEYLRQWKESLCAQVSAGGLYARSPVAHKWKAPFRSLILRECVAWRAQDLLAQAQVLHEASHTLGSRILIRSALESLAILIYINQQTKKVLDRELDYHDFDRKTSELLLGSRDGSTDLTSINIVTVLSHCEKRYPGISGIYATLSECAHPNHEGMCLGYSKIDRDAFETNFSNRWNELWSARHEPLAELLCKVFEAEYNDTWQGHFEKLEKWIEANDTDLERTKNAV